MPYKNEDYEYRLEINGEDVKVYGGNVPGLAHLAFDSVAYTRDDLNIVLFECYIGEDFDPVLHDRRRAIRAQKADLPCKKNCSWRKSKEADFYTHTRPTSVRCEVLCPSNRCGYLLRPSCYGGSF